MCYGIKGSTPPSPPQSNDYHSRCRKCPPLTSRYIWIQLFIFSKISKKEQLSKHSVAALSSLLHHTKSYGLHGTPFYRSTQFCSILRDVEANTVRLKEHGQDVLVLEKMNATYRTVGDPYRGSLAVAAGSTTLDMTGDSAATMRPRCW